MKKKLLFFLGIRVIAITGCTYDSYEELHPKEETTLNTCNIPAEVKYGTDIKPIIVAHCGVGDNSCHGHNPTSSGLNYNTYQDLSLVALQGRLIPSINHAPNADPMPKTGAKLDECSISKITKWVNNGAQNN